MMRRKSFSGYGPHELRDHLEQLEPALATLNGALTRLARSWTRLLRSSSDGGFGEDREHFASKLAALYLHDEAASNGL